MTVWDAVVIGTGPTGVSAAKPVIERGLNVLFVDAGSAAVELPKPERPPLAELRKDADRHWRYLLRDDLSALRDIGYASPKTRTAAPPEFTEGYAKDYDISSFSLTGAYALGGLTNVWGGAAPIYDAADLAAFPISPADLADGYCAVAEMVGLSGPEDTLAEKFGMEMGPPVPLSRNATLLSRRYKEGKQENGGMKLTRPVLAVRTVDDGLQKACQLDKACMWGCRFGAVYNSASTLNEFLQRENVSIITGEKATKIQSDDAGTETTLVNSQTGRLSKVLAKTTIVAAGPAASVKIIFRSIGRRHTATRFFNCPAFSFALFIPKHLGLPLEPEGFGGAQLSLSFSNNGHAGDGRCFGLVYDADGLPAADLMRHMFLTRPGAVKVLSSLMPALMVGLVYLPGKYSENFVSYRPGDGDGRLEINGGLTDEFDRDFKKTVSILRSDFSRLGAWMLPGSVKAYAPGADVHYAGGLAMGELTDVDGGVKGLPGVVVADASTFPDLPAKNHTLTAMANAHRVGTRLANSLTC